jgi:hypothetical protein
MNMLTVPASLRLAGTALLASLLCVPSELKLKESDHKAFSRLVGSYFTALDEEKGIMEAMQDVLDQIATKEKSLKGTKLLAAVPDWEQIFRLVTEARLQETLKKKGEVAAQKVKADIELNLAYCVPKKPAKGALPLVLIACDSGEDPSAHLNTYWNDPAIREGAVLVALDLGKDTQSWGAFGDRSAPGGPYQLMTALSLVSREFPIDSNRRLLVGSGKAFAAVEATATSFPHIFAGVIGIGDVASAAPANLENFRTVPTLLVKCGVDAGGEAAIPDEAPKVAEGAQAIEKKIGELGFGNCTVNVMATPAAVWEWIGKTPRMAYPTHVTFAPKTDNARVLHWLSLVGFQAMEEPKIDAKIDKATNTITIEAQKIAELVIWLNDELVDLDKPVKFVINGTTEERVLERNATEMVKNQYFGGDWGRVFTAFANQEVPVK